MILNRRIGRDLKSNIFRYLALFILITLGMYFVVSYVASADTIIETLEEKEKTNNIEDGEFSVYESLTDEQKDDLETTNITIEPLFYLDYELEDGSTIRTFCLRDKINKICVDDGKVATGNNEIVLEKHYARKHHIKIGDTLKIATVECKVTGIGSSPDYETMLETETDPSTDSFAFGTAFMTKDLYLNLKDSNQAKVTEEYIYAYKNDSSMSNHDIKEKIKSLDNVKLLSFKVVDNNPRMGSAKTDVKMNKLGGMLGGLILFALFTYVISVFIVHSIDEESQVIGTFYSMGVSKGDLLQHYILLPAIITFIGGIVGTVVGFSPLGVGMQIKTTIDYYSLPSMNTVYPIYLVAYGLIVPTVVSVLVNIIVLNSKLSSEPLKLLRHEQKQNKISKVDLKNMKYVNKFRIRQFLRELRSTSAIFIAMLLSVLLITMAMFISTSLNNLTEQNKKDITFQYMYTLKYPLEKVPEDVEAAYMNILETKTKDGENMQINILGIDSDNKYFDFAVPEGKDKIVISSSVANKFNLKSGDTMSLYNDVDEKSYQFIVDSIGQYSVGLYVFMNIDSMRELFERGKTYQNVLISDKEITIDKNQLYTLITKTDFQEFAKVFQKNMQPMTIGLYFVAIGIFLVVMYLMIKVMMERATFSISLMKIFGYQKNEIRKLYLDGNFIFTIVSALICIPISKILMGIMFPYMISYIPLGLDTTFKPIQYVLVFVLIIATYLVDSLLIMMKINRDQDKAVQILKERE